MYIVLGKFEKRNQQMQLIINQLFEVEAYEQTKLSNSEKVILRNVTHLEPQFEHSKVESNEQHALNIYGFDECANKMTMLGQIERQPQNFDLLIQTYSPADIRFI